MNNFFVAVKGKEVFSNVSKERAVAKGIELGEKDSSLCGLDIGIGRAKYVKGKRVYTMLPLSTYID